MKRKCITHAILQKSQSYNVTIKNQPRRKAWHLTPKHMALYHPLRNTRHFPHPTPSHPIFPPLTPALSQATGTQASHSTSTAVTQAQTGIEAATATSHTDSNINLTQQHCPRSSNTRATYLMHIPK